MLQCHLDRFARNCKGSRSSREWSLAADHPFVSAAVQKLFQGDLARFKLIPQSALALAVALHYVGGKIALDIHEVCVQRSRERNAPPGLLPGAEAFMKLVHQLYGLDAITWITYAGEKGLEHHCNQFRALLRKSGISSATTSSLGSRIAVTSLTL